MSADEPRALQKLDWLPLYIDKLLSSPAWQDMKDFQRGWYLQLMLRCTRSERLGYLPLDESLWRIAGAHSRPMWDAHKSPVMACFKIRQCDDRDWIYNERLLSVMEDQTVKYYRKKPPRERASNGSSVVDSKEIKEEICPEIPESVRQRNELERNDAIARAKARGFTVRDDGTCYRRAG